MEVTKCNECTVAALVILLDNALKGDKEQLMNNSSLGDILGNAMESNEVQWMDYCSLGDIVR